MASTIGHDLAHGISIATILVTTGVLGVDNDCIIDTDFVIVGIEATCASGMMDDSGCSGHVPLTQAHGAVIWCRQHVESSSERISSRREEVYLQAHAKIFPTEEF